MLNNCPLKKNSFTYYQKRKHRRHINLSARKKKKLFGIISLAIIFMSSFSISYNIYIDNNSKDLSFAVEHNFTAGFSSKNKLLRVQKMSLIYCDGENAIIEVFGLAKAAPHQSTSIKGSFKKDDTDSWYLQKLITS